MAIYEKDFEVQFKDDNSPLTLADLKANEIICKSLEKLYPQIPIMSEENAQTPYEERKNWEYYFCIDPIDGTKEFIKKNGEFTVNIALIYKGTPVLGVVLAPALGKLYFAKKGEGAFVEALSENDEVLTKEKLPLKKDRNTFKVVASKSHLSEENKQFLANLSHLNPIITNIGSSLKLCLIAQNSADIYPRLSPTMEWDTAAADAIVRESGKMTYIYENNFLSLKENVLKPLVYNKENLLNSWFVVK